MSMNDAGYRAENRRGLWTLNRCEHTAGAVTIPDVVMGRPVEAIGAGLFCGDRSLTSLHFPNSLKRIEDDAFRACTELEEVFFPDSLAYIGQFAFADCVSLRALKLPDSLKIIHYCAFNACTAVEEISFPAKMTTICNQAFAECRSVRNLRFPETLTDIGNGAFMNCLNLETVELPPNIDSIGHSAFYRSPEISNVFERIVLPKSLKLFGAKAFCCRELVIMGRTDIDRVWSGTEVIRAPRMKPEAFPELRAALMACAGFAEMHEDGIEMEEDVCTAYREKILEDPSVLYPTAVRNEALLRYMMDIHCIPQVDINCLLALCGNRIGMKAELLDYANRIVDDSEFSVSEL